MNEGILTLAIIMVILLAAMELVPRPCGENDIECNLEMRGELYVFDN